MMRLALPILAAVIIASAAPAAIYYDEARQCLRVVDFPADAPCTLARLLAMDRLYGWGKVAYDAATDTTTVTGDLWVGANDGTETCLQIGSPEHPRETLVMQGSLVLHPYWIQGDNREDDYWKAPKRANRLTLGVAGKPEITAALKFRDQERAGHTLYLGRFPATDAPRVNTTGGQLFVHHSLITSALAGQTFGLKVEHYGMNLTGDAVVLDHATISWVQGAATYGMGTPRAKVSDTTFDHVGTAIINDRHDLTRCTFTNCGIAVRDYGSIDAVLTDCVFRGNDHNWTLNYSDKGLVCIDCTWDTPRQGDTYQCWKNPQTSKTQYPSFTSMRHIIVEVLDEAGKPVAGATVRIRPAGGAAELSQNTTPTTDQQGRTPGRGQEGAVLLAEVVKQATDQPNQPRVTEFSYSLEASAKGFAPTKLTGFRPAESWQVVKLTLRRPLP